MTAEGATAGTERSDGPRRSARGWAVVVLLLVTISGLLAGLLTYRHDLFLLLPGRRRFDAVEWSSFDSEGWKRGTRRAMLADLLARHPLEGRDRGFVLDLLGPPTAGAFERGQLSPARFPQGTIAYILGSDGFADSLWLAVEFDAADRVARTRVVAD